MVVVVMLCLCSVVGGICTLGWEGRAKRMRSRTTVDLGYRVIYDRDDSKDVDVRYVFALSVTLMPVRGLE